MMRRKWLPQVLLASGITGLAAGLLWWQQPPTDGLDRRETPLRAQAPQFIVNDLYRITTSDTGEWLNTVEADHARYDDTADRLSLTEPYIRSVEGTPLRITAATATLDDGTFWTLRNRVVVITEPDSERPTTIESEYLEYDTVADTAHTPIAVTIEQRNRMVTTATGMDLYLSAQEYELHEQVRTRYLPAD